ncbi:hypothetical protein CcCBS67573_g05308 [Chytriomyces confervae]|uniref:G-protein coupled receptors family 2 profile 2 domain-containing protein n=1 Tax=Chytriomyces confervae TaxID=246404 RepID=A0A507FDS4_9FUNG|nr:hypothetical protein HDU80_011627 [Chytriomyces hyalinus]TPX73428.1 hypothetical protein CcCBS67573_g05308 [Chytriomyces confervae]
MPLSQDQIGLIRTIFYVICPVAILSDGALILSVFHFKRFRKTLHYMQTSLALSELVISVNWVISNQIVPLEALCTIVGTLHQFFAIAVTSWTFLISLYCHNVVLYGPKVADNYNIWYQVYGWGMPVIFTAAGFIVSAVDNRGNLMGDATYECWFSTAYTDLRLYLFYTVIWSHYFALVGLYARIYWVARAYDVSLSALKVKQVRASAVAGGDLASNAPSLMPSAALSSVTSTIEKSSNDHISHVNQGHNNTLERHWSWSPEARASRKQTPLTSSRKIKLRASVIAFGYVVSWSVPTINRIMQMCGQTVPYWMTAATAVCFATSSLWNSAVFFATGFSRGR